MYRLAAFGHELPLHVHHTIRTSRLVTHSWTHFRFLTVGLTSNAEYYRQTPPKVPNFYNTLFRRKLVLWFLFSLVLRDYWLSGVSAISDHLLRWFLILPCPVLRKELGLLVGYRPQGGVCSHPRSRLLHRSMGCSPRVTHLPQQNPYVVPCHLRGRYRCAALVPGR